MNKPLWPYPGSRWWKFDFHIHTPASRDTPWYKHNLQLTPEQWLLKYMNAKIDCVAVTDHNSGAWIDKLKDTYAQMKAKADAGSPPEGFRELTIFPGVEISVSGGFHLLAIFDPDATTRTITDLLAAVGYQGTDGDSDGVTREGPEIVVQAVLDAKAIPIPAHADRPGEKGKGLLALRDEDTAVSRLDANTIVGILGNEHLLAVEWEDLSRQAPECVRTRVKQFARVIGSDCHTFQGNTVPGSRYTWVKMAKPTLEGLRLALLDGNGVSIRRSDEGAFDPFKTPVHFITAIEIHSARYMGNGRAERIEITPFYNALIGGRGTGKSTFVHALRLAYGREGELESLGDNSEPLRQFKCFRKVPEARDDDGALRENTVICVELVRDGQSHRLRWRNNDRGGITVEEQDPDGEWRESQSQTVNAERFPIRLFSQGQIAAMAGERRQALLAVIDEAAQVDRLKQAFEEEKRTFLTKRARLRELEGKLAERPEVERKFAEVVRKLDAFTQAHHAEVLKALDRAQRQRRAVDQLLEQIRAFPVRIEEVEQDLILDEWPFSVFDDTSDADVLQWRKSADDAVQQARQALEQASRALAERSRVLEQDPLLAAWRERTDKAQANFDALQQTLAAQGVNDPQAFGQLVQERQCLEAQVKRLGEIKAERDTLERAIAVQWKKVVEAREAITAARAAFVRNTLYENRYVRIEVVPFGFDPRAIERGLRELLEVTDDRFQNDILAMDAAGNPTGGLAFAIPQADDRKAALDSTKKQLQTIADVFGGHFKNYLKKKLERPEFADHIQCWFPEDDLRIEYSRRADGTDWAAITQGSQGQRSAALLAFLLAFGEEPLVLDQPEDDLDNQLIYDLIVRQIRENKLRRQLVIVTHNPNIVVNGDAELVHVLDFCDGQCRVVERGALQEKLVREQVCRVMEGGREAFERRWKRLGRKV